MVCQNISQSTFLEIYNSFVFCDLFRTKLRFEWFSMGYTILSIRCDFIICIIE